MKYISFFPYWRITFWRIWGKLGAFAPNKPLKTNGSTNLRPFPECIRSLSLSRLIHKLSSATEKWAVVWEPRLWSWIPWALSGELYTWCLTTCPTSRRFADKSWLDRRSFQWQYPRAVSRWSPWGGCERSFLQDGCAHPIGVWIAT